MNIEWDYTYLARSYLKRPEYCASSLDKIFQVAGIRPGMIACDIGAGTGNLTVPLLQRGLRVVAVEPNAAMRELGISRTSHLSAVAWVSSRGDQLGVASSAFDFVSFGSSFGVMDRGAALTETARILRPGGWFVCLWNHRDLDDPLQSAIETVIRHEIPNYQYGVRRQDQSAVICVDSAFGPATKVEASFRKMIDSDEWLEAWRSHATLKRQSADRFERILDGITDIVRKNGARRLTVPYTTRAWLAQKLL